MEYIKRIWLALASSFTLNLLTLFLLILFSVLSIGNVIVWRVVAIILCINCCFLNANYFVFIRHKVRRTLKEREGK